MREAIVPSASVAVEVNSTRVPVGTLPPGLALNDATGGSVAT